MIDVEKVILNEGWNIGMNVKYFVKFLLSGMAILFLIASCSLEDIYMKDLRQQPREAVFDRCIVTNLSDAPGSESVPGTLRYVLTNAQNGDTISFNAVTPGASVIYLTKELPMITRSIIIEGNGITITPGPSWIENDVANQQMLTIDSGTSAVRINRVHFKDGATSYGAIIRAITKESGALRLESCIFSNNIAYNGGGAIYNYNDNLIVKACTFYGNKGSSYGGAILNESGTLSLTGNLFYGNTSYTGPVVHNFANVVSGGFNSADAVIGTASEQSGWIPASGDKSITGLPFSLMTFRLFMESGAADVLAELPEDYPMEDFYGNPINLGGAAGAVQSFVSSSGYSLYLSMNNYSGGSVVVSPDSRDFIFTGSVSLTVKTADGYTFSHWLVDGVNVGNVNPLVREMNDHTKIHVVFIRTVIVSSSSDAAGSASTPGTLRYALTNFQSGDSISFSGALNIELTSALPLITGSTTIEGNGSTLTRSPLWNIEDNYSQLLYINSSYAVVNINRLHFKDGRAAYGAAINKNNGTLNLESCIFSGNKASDSGGAIYNMGSLTIKGCTFYGNDAGYYGGTVANNSGTLTLTGNLFYGNTAPGYLVLTGTMGVSNGYNIVDVPLSQSGWTTASGDKSISDLPLSPMTFRLLSGSEAAGVINSLPAGYPTMDFYGDNISAGAAAGAVQSNAIGSGYTLHLTVNNSAGGSVSVSPASRDFVFSGPITLTANPAAGYALEYWLVDGVKAGNSNPLVKTLTDHTRIDAFFTRTYIVSSSSDAAGSASTPGTLRHAITNANDGDIIRFNDALTVELNSPLPVIIRKITIEGNSSTLTRHAAWNTGEDSSQLVLINSSNAAVKISRLHFKGGTAAYGAAIFIDKGSLTLESCIFSGNKASVNGSAISNNGNLTVKGCTFNNNSTDYGAGVILNVGTLTLTGNLFSGNFTGNLYNNNDPGAIVQGDSIVSGGYNAIDAEMGTGFGESGWYAAEGDTVINDLPISPMTFRLLVGSGAAGVITTIPPDYPTADFYGDSIPIGAAAGAVQSFAIGSGYTLYLSVNNSMGGSASVSPESRDYVFSGPITLNAYPKAGYSFTHWMVNGTNAGSNNPLQMNLTKHTRVEAVFSRTIIVSSSSDAAGSTVTPGTFRYALTNAQDGDLIRFDSAITIVMSNTLPEINRSITIEGNGSTLKGNPDYNYGGLYIDKGTVRINRFHFNDVGETRNNGTLTLESCIFSGNRVSSVRYRYTGVVYNFGILTVKACTFYGNRLTGGQYSSGSPTINNSSGLLYLTGNLFYGNTSISGDPDVDIQDAVSYGYNLVDVDIWNDYELPAAGDKVISTMPISTSSFKLLPDSEAAGVITVLPADYPEVDFYGNPIINGAASGAVQVFVTGNGRYLDLKVNNSNWGSVSVSPGSDGDGLYSGPVTLTPNAAAGYAFSYWLVGGNYAGGVVPLALPMNDHTRVEAVFGKLFIVNNTSDAPGSENIPGTLRHALENRTGYDVIRFNQAFTIELTQTLTVNGNLTIEGNGSTLTRSSGNYSHLLRIFRNSGSSVVNIRRLHIKAGVVDDGDAAVYCYYRIALNLESCIFSGSDTIADGGAIYSGGKMTVKACTFYGNSSGAHGGAIYAEDELRLTGNLFYGNTADEGWPVVFGYENALTNPFSGGYNVVDVPLGTGNDTQSGWNAGAGDMYYTLNPFSNAATFAPVSDLSSHIPYPPPEYFPTTDFYGNARTWPGAPGAVNY